MTVYTTVRKIRTLVGDTERPLHELTPARARQLYRKMADGYSADYHRAALSYSKRWGRWCIEQGYSRRNPWEGIKPVGKKRRGKPQLTIDESRQLYAHLVGDESMASTATLLILVVGLRASEVTNLVGRDIDDDGWVLRVAERDGKTERAKRQPRLPELLRNRMVALKRPGPVFVDDGRVLDRQWVYRAVRAQCRATGVTIVSPHGLRGTSSSVATLGGATAEMVMSQLGHTSTEVTRAHYVDPSATSTAQTRAVLRVIQGGR